MSNRKTSKLETWRRHYAALVVAVGCLYSAIVSWGNNWFMSALLVLGVVICGTMGFFDVKRRFKKEV